MSPLRCSFERLNRGADDDSHKNYPKPANKDAEDPAHICCRAQIAVSHRQKGNRREIERVGEAHTALLDEMKCHGEEQERCTD